LLLFAEGDGFLGLKTVADWITAIGFVVGLFSIWFSWWLAKRDLKKRITEAQRETVANLTRALLQSDVIETGRCLEQAREACQTKSWSRAMDRCGLARSRIPKFRHLPGLTDEDRQKLGEAVENLNVLIRVLEQVIDPDKKSKELPQARLTELDQITILVSDIEGKLRLDALEGL